MMVRREVSKPLRTGTADCRAINIGELSKLGGFKRPMHFALRGIETRSDHVKLRSLKNPDAPAQIILLDWQRITYGMKAHFVCPRCQARRAILYFDGLQAYCRVCADLRFASQRQRRRARLKLRAKKIRAALGDHLGKPGDPLPAKPFGISRKVYNGHLRQLMKVEAAIHSGERIASPRYRRERERNRDGSFVTQYDQMEMR